MSTMSFNARLDTSHHGPQHLLKDAGYLRTVWQASIMRRWTASSLSTWGASPQVKIQKIQIWRAMQRVSLYLTIGREKWYWGTSGTARLKWMTTVWVTTFFQLYSQITCPKSVHTFQLHSIYILHALQYRHRHCQCDQRGKKKVRRIIKACIPVSNLRCSSTAMFHLNRIDWSGYKIHLTLTFHVIY
jgi:hypothetical protein